MGPIQAGVPRAGPRNGLNPPYIFRGTEPVPSPTALLPAPCAHPGANCWEHAGGGSPQLGNGVRPPLAPQLPLFLGCCSMRSPHLLRPRVPPAPLHYLTGAPCWLLSIFQGLLRPAVMLRVIQLLHLGLEAAERGREKLPGWVPFHRDWG